MYHALKKAGAAAELHIFDGAPHAFDNLPEFARACVDLIVLYFDRKVVNPRPVELPEGE
jgi:acetyl esterase/lipase